MAQMCFASRLNNVYVVAGEGEQGRCRRRLPSVASEVYLGVHVKAAGEVINN